MTLHPVLVHLLTGLGAFVVVAALIVVLAVAAVIVGDAVEAALGNRRERIIAQGIETGLVDLVLMRQRHGITSPLTEAERTAFGDEVRANLSRRDS